MQKHWQICTSIQFLCVFNAFFTCTFELRLYFCMHIAMFLQTTSHLSRTLAYFLCMFTRFKQTCVLFCLENRKVCVLLCLLACIFVHSEAFCSVYLELLLLCECFLFISINFSGTFMHFFLIFKTKTYIMPGFYKGSFAFLEPVYSVLHASVFPCICISPSRMFLIGLVVYVMLFLRILCTFKDIYS